MTPERWQQVKGILEAALELDEAARPAYLAEACAADAVLREDVESFLEHGEADAFLEQPAVGRPPPIPESALAADDSQRGTVQEVRPIDLAPYTRLAVSTRSSRYELVVVAPLDLEVLVKGGRRFLALTRARFHRQDAIAVGQELRLQIGTRKVTTTKIEAIEIVG